MSGKVTNEMRYRTAEERVMAFMAHRSDKTSIVAVVANEFAHWLSLEAEEEKLLPCPFCGGEVERAETLVGKKGFSCSCGYTSKAEFGWDNAIAAHNRVCRAARDVKLAHETMNKIENSTIGFCNYEKETIMNILKRYREASYSVRAAKESEVK